MANNQRLGETDNDRDEGGSQTPYYRFLGLELGQRADGRALVRLPHKPELCNSRGEIHGGAQESLLDVALSQAIRSVLPAGSQVATITLTCNHLAAGHGDLTARGQVVQTGRSVATAEGHVEDAAGTRVACALGTYRVWRADAPAAAATPRRTP
jgi:uncharacterized protein (TIGR00369 family)